MSTNLPSLPENKEELLLPEWLKAMSDRLRVFGTYDPIEQQEEWQREFKAMARDYAGKGGMERVTTGFVAAIRDPARENRQFPPSPGQIREYIERVPFASYQLIPARPGCPLCSGTGFKYVSGNTYVSMCDCKTPSLGKEPSQP